MSKKIFLFLLFSIALFANKNIDIIKNLKYGIHKKNSIDIYLPKTNINKKVIFMVHGGAWILGDKSSKTVVKNKVNYWVSKGYIFISANYRLIPDVNVYQQAKDVAEAFSFSQKYLSKYSIKAKNFILMGHSAGAHLVSLITTDKKLINEANIKPWAGTISIDTAAFNVVEIMKNKHIKIFDRAFGSDEIFWEKVSPFHQLKSKTTPFLIICSTKRRTSCKQNNAFVNKAKSFNIKVEVLKIDLSHKNLNKHLGLENNYTKNVNKFINSL